VVGGEVRDSGFRSRCRRMEEQGQVIRAILNCMVNSELLSSSSRPRTAFCLVPTAPFAEIVVS